MNNRTIEDTLREITAPFIIEELSQKKRELGNEVRSYIFKTFALGFIAANSAVAAYIGAIYNGSNSNIRLVIPAALISLVYFGYKAAQSYSLFSGAWNELGSIERDLSEIESRHAPQ